MEALLEGGATFSETSIRRLIEEAGMSRTLFYAYFRNKSELLGYWASEIRLRVADVAEGWWSLSRPEGPDEVYAALYAVIEDYLPHVRVMAALFDAAAYDADLRAQVEQTVALHTSLVREHIAAGQRAGWVAADLVPAEAAPWLVWMLEMVHDPRLWAASDVERERLIRGAARIVWNVLYAGPRAA
ncbi:MAG: TetR/AcrR family transcriptional regulator [Solirubrobacteraceae bacterium]